MERLLLDKGADLNAYGGGMGGSSLNAATTTNLVRLLKNSQLSTVRR
jgi:hypothetical protein